MGSDLFALSALASELNAELSGGRLDKIQQPDADELRFFIRNNGKNMCLVASCNPQVPRLHLTATRKQSPKVALNFCMLLRKHLANAWLDGVGIFHSDRTIFVKFNAKNEMGDDAEYFLFAELMNRYSNLVFTDGNLIILDAIKHIPFDAERDHVVMRGVKYSPVIQRKTSYLNDCNDVLKAYTGGDIHKFILDNLSGFSGATVNEILFRAGAANETQASGETVDKIIGIIGEFKKIDSLSPCVVKNDVYPIVYKSLEGREEIKRFSTMSEAYDALNSDADAEARNRSRLKGLAQQAKRLVARIQKNIAIDLDNLRECENMEQFRIWGELIVNNIYKIKQGDKCVVCYNYYTDRDEEIPLDAKLSPSKNSTAYFNKYNKLKRTKEFAEKKLAADSELLDYAMSIQDEISTLPYDAGTAAIEDELAALGGAKKQQKKGKQRKEKPEPPYVYLVDGFYIYRGKNNLQNEEITFKIASSNDIWLHLKNEHGAHTVIITDGREVPEKVLKIACEITASTKSASANVDYTKRRNVKRKPSGHPGQVIYENYKTLLVSPDKHEEFMIR